MGEGEAWGQYDLKMMVNDGPRMVQGWLLKVLMLNDGCVAHAVGKSKRAWVRIRWLHQDFTSASGSLVTMASDGVTKVSITSSPKPTIVPHHKAAVLKPTSQLPFSKAAALQRVHELRDAHGRSCAVSCCGNAAPVLHGLPSWVMIHHG